MTLSFQFFMILFHYKEFFNRWSSRYLFFPPERFKQTGIFHCLTMCVMHEKFQRKKTHNKTLECKNDLKEYQNLIAGCFKRPLGTSLAIFNLRCDIVYCMYRGCRGETFHILKTVRRYF